MADKILWVLPKNEFAGKGGSDSDRELALY